MCKYVLLVATDQMGRWERMKQVCRVLCETCKATLFFAVQKGLSGQNWLSVIGACYCSGLMCRRGPFFIWCVIMVRYFSGSKTPGFASVYFSE